jgi:hypothetical protein
MPTDNDPMDLDCPGPADTDSFDAPLPSGMPGRAATSGRSAGGAMDGFDPCEDASDWASEQFAAQVEPSDPSQCPLASQVGEANDLLRVVTGRIDSVLASHLAGVNETLDRCTRSCSGCIDVHCDTAQAALDKRYRKIEQSLVTALSQCYNILSRFGVTFPTDDDLHTSTTCGGRPCPVLGDTGDVAEAELQLEPQPPQVPYTPPTYPPDLLAQNIREYQSKNVPPPPPTGSGACLLVDLCPPLYVWLSQVLSLVLPVPPPPDDQPDQAGEEPELQLSLWPEEEV